jgi:hypothetical protein
MALVMSSPDVQATSLDPLPARNADALASALAVADRKKFSKHCARLAKELAEGEQVTNLAVSVSGKPGVLALTNERLLFVNKPDAITPMHIAEWQLSMLASAYTAAPDHLLIKTAADKLIGFQSVSPPIAQAVAEQMWTLGVECPEGLKPDEPTSLLPSRAAADFQAALDPSDRDTFPAVCERLASVLTHTESASHIAASGSSPRALVALTNERLLFAGQHPDGRIDLTPIPFSAMISVRADTPSFLRIKLHSSNVPNADFQQMKPALANAFVEQLSAIGVKTTSADGENKSTSDQSALRVLPAKTLKIVRPHISQNEAVFLCLVGGFGQALIALGDRVLIAKAGLMSGNVFGGKVNTFPYREITGVEIHTGMTTGVLVIQTPSFPGIQAGGYWTKGKGNPAELPNAIPLPNKNVVAAWQEHLALLRTGIASGGLKPADTTQHPDLGPPIFLTPIAPPAPANAPDVPTSGGIADEIEKLAKLRDSGVLSDEEFAQAKTKLLG